MPAGQASRGKRESGADAHVRHHRARQDTCSKGGVQGGVQQSNLQRSEGRTRSPVAYGRQRAHVTAGQHKALRTASSTRRQRRGQDRSAEQAVQSRQAHPLCGAGPCCAAGRQTLAPRSPADRGERGGSTRAAEAEVEQTQQLRSACPSLSSATRKSGSGNVTQRDFKKQAGSQQCPSRRSSEVHMHMQQYAHTCGSMLRGS